LTLAKEAGIFKKNGLDVSLKMIPQKDRHLAIASGDVQCAATTVETWIVWNASGVATKQIFQMDKSYGADGMAVRATSRRSPTSRARPSRIGPGPRPTSRWPGSCEERALGEGRHGRQSRACRRAQAFVAGQNDAAMTYEPYLSTVRDNPQRARSSRPRSTTR
jgi:NitT/TauT family transport system substrate-binding protein